MADRLGWPPLSKAEWDEAKASVAVATPPVTTPTPSPAQGGPGRPSEAGPDEKGRDDKDGQRVKMAEKKTANIGDNPPPSSPESWPWLRSTPA